MYNFKQRKLSDKPPPHKDLFSPDFLRIWIVTGGIFLSLIGLFEVSGSFRSNAIWIYPFIVYSALLYLTDVFAESYSSMRYALFAICAVGIVLSLVAYFIWFPLWSYWAAIVYLLMAAVFAYIEYDF